MDRFSDSSALLSLILEQDVTDELKALLSDHPSLVIWWGTKVELISGASRLIRANSINELTSTRILSRIDALASAANEIEPSLELRNTACRILRLHDLRAADSLQLAAALIWADHHPSGLAFICLDKRLREAAAREGFDVLPKPVG